MTAKAKGRLTGYHVLFILLGFFGVMVAVNVAFTVFAVKSFPGEQVEKSYLQGLNYNQTLEDRAHQAEMGINTQIGLEANTGETIELISVWTDSSGNGLSNLAVNAQLIRPASEDGKLNLTLDPVGNGRYTASIPELSAGSWKIQMVATTTDGDTLTAEKSVLWAP
ncbi:MAG: hypothetical protein CMK09_14185 [Ponticaulis sp.]|nr:hypothetical protein [Ponticaulis sp.]|tara:strand:- start:91487 stop:91984 length:498 start_codon:yes stop_codon:yes gene_type:complete